MTSESDLMECRKRLEEALATCGEVGLTPPILLAHHLAELHDYCRVVASLLEDLSGSNVEEIRRQLWRIRVATFDHLVPHHLAPLQADLAEFTDGLSDILDEQDGGA